MGGNPRKNPPKFSIHRSYERYRAELNAWIELADYDKDKLGYVVALDLPTDESEGDVRGKVFEDLGDDLKGEAGITRLIAWLDKHYRTDEIARVIERIKTFMKTKRKKEDPVSTYLSAFDVSYNALIKAGDTRLPQSFLMYLVMENAGLSDSQWALVMAGIDTMATGTLYDQARTQLNKIIGNKKSDDEFKLRGDTLYSGDGASDVLYAGGQRRFNQRSQSGQGGWRPNFPSYTPRHPYQPGQLGAAGTPGAQGGFKPGGNIKIDVPLNPIGKDGKRNVCTICNSWSHYRAKCPYNPVNYVDAEGENTFEVNYIPGEEDTNNADKGDEVSQGIVNAMANMGTENTKSFYAELDSFVVIDVFEAGLEEVNKFDMKDELGMVVLDTGCISNVTGDKWMMTFYNKLTPFAKKMVTKTESTKVFKFGGGTKLKSMGTYTFPCNVGGKDVSLTVDVVQQPDLPCLLSQESMRKAKAVIDFEKEEVSLFGRSIKLKTNAGGHPLIQLMPYVGKEDQQTIEVLWQALDGNDQGEDFKRIMKMHEGLGHPGQKAFTDMMKTQPGFNEYTQSLINKIYQQCLSCITFKKGIPKPHVAAPLGNDFNETIAVDLKIWPKKGKIVLYIVDAFSRFTLGTEVKDKQADTIIKPILEEWILKGFGPPRQIIFDNGREFSNNKMKEMCETFNIQMLTSAGYSPFQNGLCEKGHHIVDQMVEKMMHGNPDMSFSRALAAAIYAKNCMVNVKGYSPLQLVMGKQPRMPGPAQDNMPPANRLDTNHKLTHERITDIFAARRAFSEVENSSRLKKALEVRPPKLDYFERGERVFYKQGTDPHWHGPGNVVAQDNKIVFIRHGSSIISTSPSRVQKVVQTPEITIIDTRPKKATPTLLRDDSDSDDTDSESSESESDPDDDDEDLDGGPEPDPGAVRPHLEGQGRPPAPQSPVNHQPDMGAALGRVDLNQPKENPIPGAVRNVPHTAQEEPMDMTQEIEVEQREENRGVNEEENDEENVEGENVEEERGEREKNRGENEQEEEGEHEEVKEVIELKKGKKLPAKGNWIIYKDKGEKYYFRAQVLQRVTKGTVKKNRFFNIQNENGTKDCINIDIKDWALIERPEGMTSPDIISPETGRERNRKRKKTVEKPSPNPAARKIFKPTPSVHALINYRIDQIEAKQKEEEEMMNLVTVIPRSEWGQPAVIEAKAREMDNFREHNAFEWVEDVGQPRITSGWVVTVKMFGEVKGVKVRLVAHGNQELENHPADAPTATKVGLRLLFTICAQMGWKVMTADVSSAFLQAKLTRDVYVLPPKDMQRPGMLWKLCAAMYGLDDASLLWYKTLEEVMIELGCTKLQADPAIFFFHHPETKRLEGIAGWHVDDFNGGGTDYFYDKVIKKLMKRFKFGSMATEDFKCLGWNIEHRDGAILVSQRDYIASKLEHLDIDKGECTSKDFVKKEDIPKVRGAVGQIRWITDHTRLELGFDCLQLSMNAHQPTYGDVTTINKIVTRVKNNELKLKYGKLEGDKWYVTVFADASKGNLTPDKTESAIAYVIMLTDGYKAGPKPRKCCVLAWTSRKARRVIQSTFDSEALALNTAIQAGLVMKAHLLEIMNWDKEMIKVEAYTDCNDVYQAVVVNNKPYKPAFKKGDSLAQLDVAAIRKYIQEGMVDIVDWVPSGLMLSDPLTKAGVNPEALIKAVTEGKIF